MRMTKEKFDTLKKLQGSKFTNAEKAKMVGLQPQSVIQYNRFETWDAYCAYKANLCAKHAAEKGSAEIEQLKMDMYPTTSTLDAVIEKMQQLHEDLVDLHLGVMKLINWEEKKQAQKEAYWAEQKQKKGYFNRWGDEK